jgi:hypothetical protein
MFFVLGEKFMQLCETPGSSRSLPGTFLGQKYGHNPSGQSRNPQQSSETQDWVTAFAEAAT